MIRFHELVFAGIASTVGFGDITPKADLGRFIASCMMLLGWSEGLGVAAEPSTNARHLDFDAKAFTSR